VEASALHLAAITLYWKKNSLGIPKNWQWKKWVSWRTCLAVGHEWVSCCPGVVAKNNWVWHHCFFCHCHYPLLHCLHCFFCCHCQPLVHLLPPPLLLLLMHHPCFCCLRLIVFVYCTVALAVIAAAIAAVIAVAIAHWLIHHSSNFCHCNTTVCHCWSFLPFVVITSLFCHCLSLLPVVVIIIIAPLSVISHCYCLHCYCCCCSSFVIVAIDYCTALFVIVIVCHCCFVVIIVVCH